MTTAEAVKVLLTQKPELLTLTVLADLRTPEQLLKLLNAIEGISEVMGVNAKDLVNAIAELKWKKPTP